MRRAGAAGTALSDGAGGGGGAGTERSGPTAPWAGVVSSAGPGLLRDFLLSSLFSFSLLFPPSSPFSPPGTGPLRRVPDKVMQRRVPALPPDLRRPRPAGGTANPPAPAPRTLRPAQPRPGELSRPGRRGLPGGSTGPPGVSALLAPLRAHPRHFAAGSLVSSPPAGAAGAPRAGPAAVPSRPGAGAVARSAAGALFFPFPLFNSYPFLIKTSPSARF